MALFKGWVPAVNLIKNINFYRLQELSHMQRSILLYLIYLKIFMFKKMRNNPQHLFYLVVEQ